MFHFATSDVMFLFFLPEELLLFNARMSVFFFFFTTVFLITLAGLALFSFSSGAACEEGSGRKREGRIQTVTGGQQQINTT